MTIERDSKILRSARGGLYYLQQIFEELEDPKSISITELKHLAGHIEYELKALTVLANLTPEAFYSHVWDIMVEHAGASKTTDARRDFVFHMTDMERPVMEYRFQGFLGFGGKIWREAAELKVSCYKEDSNGESLAIVEKVNTLLAKLSAV